MAYVIWNTSLFQAGMVLALAAFTAWALRHILKPKHRHAQQRGSGTSGPHKGIMVDTGLGFIEITIFESDLEPRFRLYFYDQEKQPVASPESQEVLLKTVRPDGDTILFVFSKGGDYLQSSKAVPEPHDFKIIVKRSSAERTYSYEIHYSRANRI